jgi:hypothetical protein
VKFAVSEEYEMSLLREHTVTGEFRCAYQPVLTSIVNHITLETEQKLTRQDILAAVVKTSVLKR